MSSFQHFDVRIWSSRVHHAACFGSVNFCVPTTAALTSATDLTDCDPRMLYSHPPNQPSFTPPAIGVMPAARRVLQAESSWLQVLGAEAMPAFFSTSLR